MIDMALCEALEDALKTHCRRTKASRKRGVVRSKLITAAEDALLAVVTAAGAPAVAETILACEELRRRSPNTFVTTRTYHQQRTRLLSQADIGARYTFKGRIHSLKVPPVRVSEELNVILDRLVKSAQDTITPKPQGPPPNRTDDRGGSLRRGRPLGHGNYDNYD